MSTSVSSVITEQFYAYNFCLKKGKLILTTLLLGSQDYFVSYLCIMYSILLYTLTNVLQSFRDSYNNYNSCVEHIVNFFGILKYI